MFATSATCLNVILGFFPSKPHRFRGQKVHRHALCEPVSDSTLAHANFEYAKARLRFRSLEPLLNGPLREPNRHQLLDVRVRQFVTHEIIDSLDQRIADHNKPVSPVSGMGHVGVRVPRIDQMNTGRFHLPNHRSLSRGLDLDAFPFLLGKTGLYRHTFSTCFDAWVESPIGILASQAQITELEPEFRNLAIIFTKGNPTQANAGSNCMLQLVNPDSPFRPVHDVIRDTRLFAAWSIIRPHLGNISVIGQYTTKRGFGSLSVHRR